jgi:portal protein
MGAYTGNAVVRGVDTNPDDRDAQTSKAEQVRQFLNKALDDFKLSAEAEAEQREEMAEDEEFRTGEMWPDDILEKRVAANKPCLTIDQISGPIKQITGEERQAKPAIHVSPDGLGADKDSAEAREGLARAIQADSQAEIAFDHAFEKAVTIGLGWFLLDTEYEDDESFDQVIKIHWIENPFCVYSDPAWTQPLRKDMRFAHIKSWMHKEAFEAKYGEQKDALASLQEYSSKGDADPAWFSTDNGYAISRYFYIDFEQVLLAQVTNGDVLDITDASEQELEAIRPLITETRTANKRVVKCAVICATAILEGNDDLTAGREFPCSRIPLVPVEGELLMKDGKRILRGIIRQARDPQRMYNVLVSTGMEVLALTPRAPYVAAAGQVAQYKAMWEEANSESFSVLPYDPMEVGGVLVPAPQRQQVEPAIQAIFASIRQAANDLHTVLGFFDASDPTRPNSEQSGKAIDARRSQGAVAHINLLDNLQRSLTYGGEILIDMMWRVYDRPGRVVRLLGMDDSPTLVKIGPEEEVAAPSMVQRVGAFANRLVGRAKAMLGGQAPTTPPAPMKVIDLRPKGRYAVRATVGASFTTRRQEVVAQLTELFKAYPPLATAGMDILLANMDGPGMKQLAERMKRVLPAEFRDPNEDAQEPVPAHAAAKMAQQEQAIQFLTQHLQEAIETIKTKRLELTSRERIALMQTQTQIAVTIAKLGSDADRQVLDQEFQRFTTIINQLHEQEADESSRQHELLMGDRDQQHQMGMAGADAAHAAAQQVQAAQLAPTPGATVGAAG